MLFRSGKGNDAIADMVELDDEDPADLAAQEGRPAGHHQPGRLWLDREIIVVLRQMRMKKRIARDKDMPPLGIENHRIVFIFERRPADHLMVDQPGVRGVDVEQAALPGAQAIIDIVVDDPVGFVEAAKRIEGFPRSEERRVGKECRL